MSILAKYFCALLLVGRLLYSVLGLLLAVMSPSPSKFRAILPELAAALRQFQLSNSRFTVVRSIRSDQAPHVSRERPRTLLILDSSFNPPHNAHQAIARSALAQKALAQYTAPVRVLLLFSTHNADKAAGTAASFEQRLALMTLFGEDLLRTLRAEDGYSETTLPDVDIGLTKEPYYTDKSTAIMEDGSYSAPGAVHVHLMGYDTFTRFLAAKYYPDFQPPLSALDPYFDTGHRLQVTLRPSDEFGSVQEQKDFIEGLARGALERDGGKRSWGEQIVTIEAEEGVGVSSTRVREAARKHRWTRVDELCTQSVAEAIRTEGIYDSDEK